MTVTIPSALVKYNVPIQLTKYRIRGYIKDYIPRTTGNTI